MEKLWARAADFEDIVLVLTNFLIRIWNIISILNDQISVVIFQVLLIIKI